MKTIPIIINARFLTQKITGVQRFAAELSKRLKKEAPHIIFVAPRNILHKELAEELGVIIIGRLTGALWEQIELPFFLKKHNPDIVLNLCNTAPLLYKKNIVTIHDLAVWDFPSAYSFPFRIFYKLLLPRIAHKALKIVTVSKFSKSRIMEILSIKEERIAIISNAAANFFCKSESEKQKYILAVSSIDPKKNFKRLIKAFQKANLPDYKLYLAGNAHGIFQDNGLKSLIEADSRIQFTGYVSDSELEKLYQRADFFVYPTLYEGFGIPPLEAMASGCPVIASEIPAIQEVCGDACLYINPESVNDIADKITVLAYDKTLKEKLIQRGIKQSEDFSWEASGSNLWHLLITCRVNG